MYPLNVVVFVAKLILGSELLVAAAATRSPKEIKTFRRFLKSTQTDEGTLHLLRGWLPPRVNPEELSGKYQGDIVLDDANIDTIVEQYAVYRSAYILTDTQWPNNTVVWEFKENEFESPQQQAILNAMKLIERMTCVKFRKRKQSDTIYVSITGKSDGCYANIGYRAPRGVHMLNLARDDPGVGCLTVGTIVHEIMHILGFFHMHCTHNRDEYIRVVESNIIPGTEQHFTIFGSDQLSNLGVEYEYVSCLHYGPYAFSANGNATIVALKEFQGQMGQRDFVTNSDWLRINRHYNCPGAWDEKYRG